MVVKRQRREPENRSDRLKLRLTPSELATLKARAKAAGMDMSAFVRVSAMHAKIRTKFDPEALTALNEQREELAHLGNSLKLWLDGQSRDDVVDPAALLAEIQSQVGKLAKTAEQIIPIERDD